MNFAAKAADAPATMIIFDGSGSMWGRLDAEKKLSKLDLAREAVRTSLPKSAAARYGLMSFGHRRSGDCSDIEIIAPVAEGDPARIMTPLDKLNPRGKGPIAGAIKEAAKALGSNPQASIVLIHDNADNCRQDPCETAAEIAAENPKLKIHLVSLVLDKEELARVACIPKTTGGQLFDVKDAAGLPAAIANAFKLAFLDTGEGEGQTQANAGKAAPASVAPQGPPGLALSARLAAQSSPVSAPVQWRVFKAGSESAIFEALASQITAPLEAGSYMVEGSLGFASARKAVDVLEKGPTRLDLPLEAAALRVTVRDLKDGPASASALVTLRAEAAGANQPARPMWIGRAREADFVVPPGNYRVHVSESLTELDEAVTLAAGNIVNKDIVMNAGHLELTAAAKPEGEPLEGVTFLIAKDDPEAPEGRREIARSAALKPTFALPAGTYYVTARTGSAEVRQRVAIGAGDNVKRSISLGLAKLSVGAELAAGKKEGSAALPKLSIATRILSLDGEPHEVARSTTLAPEFTLAAGRYRIEASIGALNVKASQDIDLEAGSNRRVGLKLDANTITLKFANAVGAAPPANLSWELRDSQGGVLMRSSQPAPNAIVAPGRYTARLDAGDKRIEKTVDVTADGVPRVVEFALP